MIKLKVFLQDPLSAYESYKKEYQNRYRNLIKENLKLAQDNAKLKIDKHRLCNQLDIQNQRDMDVAKIIRTLHWYYTGEKLRKGTEWDYLEKIKEESCD